MVFLSVQNSYTRNVLRKFTAVLKTFKLKHVRIARITYNGRENLYLHSSVMTSETLEYF